MDGHFWFDPMEGRIRLRDVSPHYEMTLRTALAISIRKWREVVRVLKVPEFGVPNEGGVTTCGLCIKYLLPNDGNSLKNCIGCPIQEETHERYCAHTPYEYYETVRERYEDIGGETPEEIKARERQLKALALNNAKDELGFLRTLARKYRKEVATL